MGDTCRAKNNQWNTMKTAQAARSFGKRITFVSFIFFSSKLEFGQIGAHIILAILAVIWVFPIFWVVLTSFRAEPGAYTTTFLPTGYTYRTDPQEICETWKKRVQKRGLDAFLLPFGYGDGGGGPTRDHIEYLLREADLEGMPRDRKSTRLNSSH